MSIATLKKKTKAQYNKVSVGYPQFSLNGTHRSQGYVGQDSLSRTLPITHRRGTEAIGFGGCCNTYRQSNIIYGTGVVSLNDPTVVKSSVMNTSGRLLDMYNCNPAQCTKTNTSFNTVKYIPPYLNVLQRRKNNCNTQKDVVSNTCNTCVDNLSSNAVKHAFKYMYMKNIDFTPHDSVTKKAHTDTQSERLDQIQTICAATDKQQFLSNVRSIPFACHQ
jgi:hypothetical protein